MGNRFGRREFIGHAARAALMLPVAAGSGPEPLSASAPDQKAFRGIFAILQTRTFEALWWAEAGMADRGRSARIAGGAASLYRRLGRLPSARLELAAFQRLRAMKVQNKVR